MNLKGQLSKIVNEELDKLVGGKSDGMSLQNIADKHKVSLQSIKNQLEKGIKVEREHTKNPDIARKIAMDHLVELPDYYSRLNKMEKEGEK